MYSAHYSLGTRRRMLRSFDPPLMRIDADIRKCVVFIGHADRDNDDSFVAGGTGFFVYFKGFRYLVTNQHVALQFGDGPFCVRINRTDGASDNVFCDPAMEPLARWHVPADPDIDLVAAPWHFDLEGHGFDVMTITGDILLRDDAAGANSVSVGDLCYAVGLFRLLQGNKRNVPVVHTGHVALMPDDELIPVDDWMAPQRGRRRHVRGYLVQMQNLKGLSGAPVLVRPGLNAIAQEFAMEGRKIVPTGKGLATVAYNADVSVLGIWSASWDAPPDEVAAVEYGSSSRVPVGLGTVIPAQCLIDLLSTPEADKRREQWLAKSAADHAASPDGAAAS